MFSKAHDYDTNECVRSKTRFLVDPELHSRTWPKVCVTFRFIALAMFWPVSALWRLMNPITISSIVFVCVLIAFFVGMILRAKAPESHISNEAEDIIKLGLGLITTMTALVLGLLISTAKGSYDLKRTQLAQIAADTILVDRSLALYGSETSEARSSLHELVAGLANQVQSIHGEQPKREPGLKAETADFYQMVRQLAPRDDTQKSLKTEVLAASFEVGQIRALALSQWTSSIPTPFLVVLVFWLAILFTGFGFFAPRNLTVATALCICAFTVSAAFFMIIGMDQPLSGFTHVSAEPLRNALIVIGR
jgi:hypothetical protein